MIWNPNFLNPTISIIAALGENRELGLNNKIPWHIKKDIEHFKKLTTGHPVIMGRKTFESIGKPLPNRTNIVVTRDQNFSTSRSCHPRVGGDPGFVFFFQSLEDAIKFAKTKDSGEVFIIGGASIYAQAMKYTDKLYLTLIKGTFDADAFFPDYSEFKKELGREEGTEGDFCFTFLELVR